MKRIVMAFPRDRYCSDSTGNPQLTLMQEKLMPILGSAYDMRWEVTTYATSSATARMLVALTGGTKTDARPSMNIFAGVPITFFPAGGPTPAPTLGAVETQVSGPFAGLVDAVIKVWDSAGSPSMVWVDAGVRVTLFYK